MKIILLLSYTENPNDGLGLINLWLGLAEACLSSSMRRA